MLIFVLYFKIRIQQIQKEQKLHMQTGATNMDSNTVELEIEEPLMNGSQKFLPKKVKDILKEQLPLRWMEALQKNNAIIAGGVFASIYTETPIADIDVFFPSVEHANKFLSSINAPYSKQGKGNITLGKLQIIRFNTADTPEKLFETFDILASQIAYNCATNSFHSAEGAIDDLINKQIRVVRRTNSLEVALQRVAKWKKSKGMQIHPDTWKLMEETCNQPDEQFNTLFTNYITSVPAGMLAGHGWFDGVRAVVFPDQAQLQW